MKQNEESFLSLETRLRKIVPQQQSLEKGIKKEIQAKSELQMKPLDGQLPLKSSFAQKYFNQLQNQNQQVVSLSKSKSSQSQNQLILSNSQEICFDQALDQIQSSRFDNYNRQPKIDQSLISDFNVKEQNVLNGFGKQIVKKRSFIEPVEFQICHRQLDDFYREFSHKKLQNLNISSQQNQQQDQINKAVTNKSSQCILNERSYQTYKNKKRCKSEQKHQNDDLIKQKLKREDIILREFELQEQNLNQQNFEGHTDRITNKKQIYLNGPSNQDLYTCNQQKPYQFHNQQMSLLRRNYSLQNLNINKQKCKSEYRGERLYKLAFEINEKKRIQHEQNIIQQRQKEDQELQEAKEKMAALRSHSQNFKKQKYIDYSKFIDQGHQNYIFSNGMCSAIDSLKEQQNNQIFLQNQNIIAGNDQSRVEDRLLKQGEFYKNKYIKMLKDKQEKENELLKEVPQINQKSVKILMKDNEFKQINGEVYLKTDVAERLNQLHRANKEKILMQEEHINDKLKKAESSRNICLNILEKDYQTKVQKMDAQRLQSFIEKQKKFVEQKKTKINDLDKVLNQECVFQPKINEKSKILKSKLYRSKSVCGDKNLFKSKFENIKQSYLKQMFESVKKQQLDQKNKITSRQNSSSLDKNKIEKQNQFYQKIMQPLKLNYSSTNKRSLIKSKSACKLSFSRNDFQIQPTSFSSKKSQKSISNKIKSKSISQYKIPSKYNSRIEQPTILNTVEELSNEMMTQIFKQNVKKQRNQSCKNSNKIQRWKQLYEMGKNKDQKIQIYRQKYEEEYKEKQEEIVRQCTFQPKINQNSKIILKNRLQNKIMLNEENNKFMKDVNFPNKFMEDLNFEFMKNQNNDSNSQSLTQSSNSKNQQIQKSKFQIIQKYIFKDQNQDQNMSTEIKDNQNQKSHVNKIININLNKKSKEVLNTDYSKLNKKSIQDFIFRQFKARQQKDQNYSLARIQNKSQNDIKQNIQPNESSKEEIRDQQKIKQSKMNPAFSFNENQVQQKLIKHLQESQNQKQQNSQYFNNLFKKHNYYKNQGNSQQTSFDNGCQMNFYEEDQDQVMIDDVCLNEEQEFYEQNNRKLTESSQFKNPLSENSSFHEQNYNDNEQRIQSHQTIQNQQHQRVQNQLHTLESIKDLQLHNLQVETFRNTEKEWFEKQNQVIEYSILPVKQLSRDMAQLHDSGKDNNFNYEQVTQESFHQNSLTKKIFKIQPNYELLNHRSIIFSGNTDSMKIKENLGIKTDSHNQALNYIDSNESISYINQGNEQSIFSKIYSSSQTQSHETKNQFQINHDRKKSSIENVSEGVHIVSQFAPVSNFAKKYMQNQKQKQGSSDNIYIQ